MTVTSLLFVHTLSAVPSDSEKLSSFLKFKGFDAVVAHQQGATVVEFDPESQKLAAEPKHLISSYSKADIINNLEQDMLRSDNAFVMFSAGPCPNEQPLVDSFVKAVAARTGKRVRSDFSAVSSFIFFHHKSLNIFVYDTIGRDVELQLEYFNGEFVPKKQTPEPEAPVCIIRPSPSNFFYLRYVIFALFLTALILSVYFALVAEEVEYLSDRYEVTSRNVHGGVGKDRAYFSRHHGFLVRDGHDLSVHHKGILQHAPERGDATIVYALNKQYSKFKAMIGHAESGFDTRDYRYAYQFEVKLDGKVKYSSKIFVPSNHSPEYIEVDVSNADSLVLVTRASSTEAIPVNFCAHSVWADARLVKK